MAPVYKTNLEHCQGVAGGGCVPLVKALMVTYPPQISLGDCRCWRWGVLLIGRVVSVGTRARIHATFWKCPIQQNCISWGHTVFFKLIPTMVVIKYRGTRLVEFQSHDLSHNLISCSLVFWVRSLSTVCQHGLTEFAGSTSGESSQSEQCALLGQKPESGSLCGPMVLVAH
jgi:hypothetical protein